MVKNILFALIVFVSSNSFAATSSDDSFDAGINLLSESLKFIQTYEPIKKGQENVGPLHNAYMCVYTKTFTAIMLKHMNKMMENFLKEVRDSSHLAEFVFGLIEQDDPQFFRDLFSDEDQIPTIVQCEQEISLARRQKYVNRIVIDKVISLATLTGLKLGEGMAF